MKKIFIILMISISFLLAAENKSVKKGKDLPKKTISLEELRNGEKINFAPLALKPDYDLFTNLRLVILNTRKSPSFAPNVDLPGVSPGNGIFIDGDYNVSLSLEKYFQAGLKNRENYSIKISKITGNKKTDFFYKRENNILTATADNRETFNAAYTDGKIKLKNPEGMFSFAEDLIQFTMKPRINGPSVYEVAKTAETVTYSFGVPAAPITLLNGKISVDIPSDYFLSDIYSGRPYTHFDIENRGDTISVSGGKKASAAANFTLIQNAKGLFILNEIDNGFFVSQDEKKIIHVHEVKAGEPKEIMMVEGLN